MQRETCRACGETFSGDDRVAFVEAAFEHYTKTHPQWGLTRTSVENWVDARERLPEPGQRVPEIGPISVHQVTPDRIGDVLHFFDRGGFAGNPQWASCYCMFFHRDDPESNGSLPWRRNRADIAGRLREGSTIAYLAYVDGKPAGWCNASLRSAYPIRRKSSGDDETGVVACFVIAPAYRRHGLSRRLLDAAVEGFKARGVKKVEAHPLLDTQEDAPNYHGPLSLFLGAGFEVVEKDDKAALVAKQIQ